MIYFGTLTSLHYIFWSFPLVLIKNVWFSSFSSGIFIGFLLLNVDGDDMKMKKKRRR